jgi:hypothetical protein
MARINKEIHALDKPSSESEQELAPEPAPLSKKPAVRRKRSKGGPSAVEEMDTEPAESHTGMPTPEATSKVEVSEDPTQDDFATTVATNDAALEAMDPIDHPFAYEPLDGFPEELAADASPSERKAFFRNRLRSLTNAIGAAGKEINAVTINNGQTEKLTNELLASTEIRTNKRAEMMAQKLDEQFTDLNFTQTKGALLNAEDAYFAAYTAHQKSIHAKGLLGGVAGTVARLAEPKQLKELERAYRLAQAEYLRKMDFAFDERIDSRKQNLKEGRTFASRADRYMEKVAADPEENQNKKLYTTADIEKRYSRMIAYREVIRPGIMRKNLARMEALDEKGLNTVQKTLTWAGRKYGEMNAKLESSIVGKVAGKEVFGKKISPEAAHMIARNTVRGARLLATSMLVTTGIAVTGGLGLLTALGLGGARLLRSGITVFGGAGLAAGAGKGYAETFGKSAREKGQKAETGLLRRGMNAKQVARFERDSERGTEESIEASRKRIEAATVLLTSLGGAAWSLEHAQHVAMKNTVIANAGQKVQAGIAPEQAPKDGWLDRNISGQPTPEELGQAMTEGSHRTGGFFNWLKHPFGGHDAVNKAAPVGEQHPAGAAPQPAAPVAAPSAPVAAPAAVSAPAAPTASVHAPAAAAAPSMAAADTGPHLEVGAQLEGGGVINNADKLLGHFRDQLAADPSLAEHNPAVKQFIDAIKDKHVDEDKLTRLLKFQYTDENGVLQSGAIQPGAKIFVDPTDHNIKFIQPGETQAHTLFTDKGPVADAMKDQFNGHVSAVPAPEHHPAAAPHEAHGPVHPVIDADKPGVDSDQVAASGATTKVPESVESTAGVLRPYPDAAPAAPAAPAARVAGPEVAPAAPGVLAGGPPEAVTAPPVSLDVPAPSDIRFIDFVKHLPAWEAHQNNDSWVVFSKPAPLGTPEATLRTDLLDVMRQSGIGPKRGESLAGYLDRASVAYATHPFGVDTENASGVLITAGPSVYHSPAGLVVHGGDFNARSMLAYEYLRQHPDSEPLIVEGFDGKPAMIFSPSSTTTGVYNPSKVPFPPTSAFDRKL